VRRTYVEGRRGQLIKVAVKVKSCALPAYTSVRAANRAMSVAVGGLLAHGDHVTAWPLGFCQAHEALMLVSGAAQ
jgi:hypothetical protein